jgi:PD-(D/E)XK nuclease superfamily protein
MVTSMPNPRKYTDEQLVQALSNHDTWPDVLEAIGKKRSGNRESIRSVARRLELDYSHIRDGNLSLAVSIVPLPFREKAEGTSRKRTPGLLIATRWFLDRGYMVSLPVEVTHYDLLVESDDGIKKVQVKTANQVSKNGRYLAKLLRTIYDPEAPPTAAGRYRQVPYSRGMVDYFFIVTEPGLIYLLPFETVENRQGVTLDVKYRDYIV